MTRFEVCSFPRCERRCREQLDQPICTHHAREVYLAVKDLLDRAPVEVLATAANGQGRALRNQRDTLGLVYFARIGERVKVGFTTDLPRRMKTLGVDEVLGTMPGTRRTETQMHVRFRSSWLGGEYFHPDPDLLAFAASLGGGA